MERIIVGFDGSPAAAQALTWAVDEAHRHRAKLTAWTFAGGRRPIPVPPAADEPAGASAALRAVQSAAERLLGDAPGEHRIGAGDPAAELVRASADADLLVVGSRGASPVAGLLLGSISRACLHAAHCSVVVVRPPPEPSGPHRRVIVGIDASPASRHALAVAAEEARLRGAVLHAIHAVHWDHLGAELVAPTTRQLIALGKHLVDAELAGSGVSARPVVIPGHAGDVLVRHSAHADLLVVGSRGHGLLAGLLLGSTSDHCVRHAGCPVMVVRASADRAAEFDADRPG
jgi:nucleotide-binding universal stress UspA family protein